VPSIASKILGQWCENHLTSTNTTAGQLLIDCVAKNRNSLIMETIPQLKETPAGDERLAYSVQEAADLLGVHYFSVYRLIQRRKLKVCRALRGKLLVPRAELLRLLQSE